MFTQTTDTRPPMSVQAHEKATTRLIREISFIYIGQAAEFHPGFTQS